MKPSTVRVLGVLTGVGAIVWSIGWLQLGVPPEGTLDQKEVAAGGVFQLGLLGLLAVMRATKATGTGRWGRLVLDAGIVMVVLAFAWTVPYAIDPARPDNIVLTVLDVFWPLSMVWLIVVGVAVVRAGRWPTPARYLPLAASLLIPVDLLLMAVPGLGDWTLIVVRSVYFAVAYTLVGLVVVRQVAPLVESPDGSPRPGVASHRTV